MKIPVIGSVGALAHLLKVSLGSGVLAMPLAFKNAGYLVGIFGTILIGFICGHVIHILLQPNVLRVGVFQWPYTEYVKACTLEYGLERVGEVWGLDDTDRAPQSTAAGLGPLMLSVFLGARVVNGYGGVSVSDDLSFQAPWTISFSVHLSD
ncbi:Amino acid transporter [Operophtera brumata]|uniref:Amino acid transporter n=1 Tax=Operophtera brumata TaxID=104452 RepID=A0A0L7KP02_OPEBR|nr:Amino acid transporter [Operophtera brumata]